MVILIGILFNIIIVLICEDIFGVLFWMFDFVLVGGLMVFVGLVFVVLIGWCFIFKCDDVGSVLIDFIVYFVEFIVFEDSKLFGKWFVEFDI